MRGYYCTGTYRTVATRAPNAQRWAGIAVFRTDWQISQFRATESGIFLIKEIELFEWPAAINPCPETLAYKNSKHLNIDGRCEQCGGSAICSHGRQKSWCKECGGLAICSHGRHRSQCKECPIHRASIPEERLWAEGMPLGIV